MSFECIVATSVYYAMLLYHSCRNRPLLKFCRSMLAFGPTVYILSGAQHSVFSVHFLWTECDMLVQK